ncbi:MAG: serine racemase VanT catalytic subunit [Defluviitaleaceae bacterium]|nr:serine racemase VanT catalytic subunit [Defluviitaleaceae bacterium]
MNRAWAEIDISSLRHNVDVLRGLLPKNCTLMPAVKANAYGHGAVEISRELNTYGIKAFCVAAAREGAVLRKNGIKGEILVLGYTHPGDFNLLDKYSLTQTVVDYNHAMALNSYGKTIMAHVAIDTGMRRIGERSENVSEIANIFKCKNLIINGIYTHCNVIDSRNPSDINFTNDQIQKFYSVLNQLKLQGVKLPKVHIQSSYGVFNYPHLSCDYARVGIALFGMLSTRSDTESYNTGLRPVLSVKTRISAIKTVTKGEPVGYGLAFTAEHDMKIAVLAIGYADGVPRSLSCGTGYVLINGQKAPVVGRVCMDQMMVDVTGIIKAKQGSTAVIIGKSGNAEITACQVAEQAGTIANEILSRLGERLERRIINADLLQQSV